MRPGRGLEGRRVGFSQGIKAARDARYVYSERELIAALTEIMARQETAIVDVVPTIVIAGSIRLTKTITVAASVSILSLGLGTILTDVGPAFQVKAADVSLIGLLIKGASALEVNGPGILLTNAPVRFTLERCRVVAESTLGTAALAVTGNSASRARIINCDLTGDVDGNFDDSIFSGLKVSGNFVLGSASQRNIINGSALAAVDLDGQDHTLSGCSAGAVTSDAPRSVIMGNRLNGSDIVVSAGGQENAIVGNSMNQGDITTSASAGRNTIAANTDVGTVTAAGSDDATGGNT